MPPTKFREEAYQNILNKKLKLGFLIFRKGEKYLDGVESLPVSTATSMLLHTVRDELRA